MRQMGKGAESQVLPNVELIKLEDNLKLIVEILSIMSYMR